MRATHLLLFIAFVWSGCGFDPPGFQGFKCAFDQECPTGQVCASGVCSAPGNTNNMTPEEDMSKDMDPGLPCDTDFDNDGFFVGPGCAPEVTDCDDTSREVFPGAPAVCNGKDNNCDGLEDRETCACQDGASEACGESLGECVAGTRTCTNGMWGECTGRVGPTQEVCDTRDNDCDGEIDETFPSEGSACQTGMSGVCAGGVTMCVGGAPTCVAQVMPSEETCDGLDNDCDGDIDEDPIGLALLESCQHTCPMRSYRVCSGGTWSACNVASVEQCDQTDTNCDGEIDNMAPCLFSCNGEAIEGTLVCDVTGGGHCQLPRELCGDGVDNDCDGQVDEECTPNNPIQGMLYVAGGKFVMGSYDTDFDAADDEKPVHDVTLRPFYIDRTEVSRVQYLACIRAGACTRPIHGDECLAQNASGPAGRLPVTCISSMEAQMYCSFVSKRLPTEAEWEKTARGPYPRTPLFPWGGADNSRAVMDCSGDMNSCLQPVDSFAQGASYYGALHMSGNVAEFVQDQFWDDFYSLSPLEDPVQLAFSMYGSVLRGGAWDHEYQYGRTANRTAEYLGISAASMGFRCAMDAP